MNPHRETAFAIRVGDQWFGGFGGTKDSGPITKLRDGLCDALLINGNATAKRDDYLARLAKRGFVGLVAVRITVQP